MRFYHRKLWVGAVLPALFLLAGCESGSDPIPDALLGPGAENALISDGGKTYTLATTWEPSSEITASAVIGPEGGVLQFDAHSLTVPALAVSEPVLFTATLQSGDNLKVDLSASEADSGGPVTSFLLPLSLALSYKNVKVSNPNRLVILWLRSDGTVEELPSRLDRRQKLVIGSLLHFSQYAMAMD
ncbi:MAG: hypothetical protein HY704_17235 [Gemmatimonadetes bacterium]|nr:hypothetical protein [Gemmatimonadota bacterium]